MYNILYGFFFHSLAMKHMGRFCFLDIGNIAAVNMCGFTALHSGLTPGRLVGPYEVLDRT